MPQKKVTAKPKIVPKRTYLIFQHEEHWVNQNNGMGGRRETKTVARRIEVPAAWKCTYGGLHGANGTKGFSSDNGGGHFLRFYENQTKQRAVFNNVTSFFDISSLKIEKKISSTEEITAIRNDISQAGRWEQTSDDCLWYQEHVV